MVKRAKLLKNGRYKLRALSSPMHFHPMRQNSTACLQNPEMGQLPGWKSSRDLLNHSQKRDQISGSPNLWSFTLWRAFSQHGPNPRSRFLLKYCSEPYLTSQLTQGAILHPLCRVGSGRSCWDDRCELFGQASPEPASLWERGSQSQAALLSSTSLTASQPDWPAFISRKLPSCKELRAKQKALLEGSICKNTWICCSRLGYVHSHHTTLELLRDTTAGSSR